MEPKGMEVFLAVLIAATVVFVLAVVVWVVSLCKAAARPVPLPPDDENDHPRD